MDEKRLLVDRRTAELVRTYIPKEQSLTAMGDFFAALSDRTRLKILSAVSISEMCVTDISLLLGINQTTVSHQLRTLRSVGAVKVRRQGKVSFYSIGDRELMDIMLKATSFI